MKIRFRIAVPIVMGTLTALLTVWDVHNWRVIESMGMAWDTGAPGWPYQASDIFLRLINFPAFVIAMPFANLFGWLAPRYHLAIFPFSLLCWWLLGLFFDRRLLMRVKQRNWAFCVALFSLSGLFLTAAVIALIDTYDWWSKYGGVGWKPNILTALFLIRLATPAIWCLTLFLIFAFAAKRACPRMDVATIEGS
jgi:hypothetical protein